MDIQSFPYLPKDSTGPIFSAPWAARAFAMTLQLHKSGLFSWPEWVAAFSAELAGNRHGEHAKAGDVDDYYECWVGSLEKLLSQKGIVDAASLGASRAFTAMTWPEPNHTAHREPIVRSLPIR